jgi:hypothetical protein
MSKSFNEASFGLQWDCMVGIADFLMLQRIEALEIRTTLWLAEFILYRSFEARKALI